MRPWTELLSARKQDVIPVQRAIEAIESIDWFSRIGTDLPANSNAVHVHDWAIARSIFDDIESRRYGPNGHLVNPVNAVRPVFENTQLRARWDAAKQGLGGYRAAIPKWMETVETASVRTMEDEVSEYCYEFVSFLLMEIIGGNLVQSTYFREMLEWFAAGYFPCGWDGNWPSGRFIVYSGPEWAKVLPVHPYSVTDPDKLASLLARACTVFAPSEHTARAQIVVDSAGAGAFTGIGDAIRAAAPGTCVLVRPGSYAESLVIDKPLIIIGDGPKDEISIIGKSDDTIFFTASNGYISNLTIGHTDEGEGCAVWSERGRLTLDECVIANERSIGVVLFDESDTVLRNTKVHNCGHIGVAVRRGARATFDDSMIAGCGSGGIEARHGAELTIRKTDVFGTDGPGIAVLEQSRATIEESAVHTLGAVCIEVGSGGDAVVRRNSLRFGHASGVVVHSGGRALIEANEIKFNAHDGIRCSDGEVIARDNRIEKNRAFGVAVREGGTGTFDSNDVRGNGLGAWSLDPESASRVTRTDNAE